MNTRQDFMNASNGTPEETRNEDLNGNPYRGT